MRVSTQDPGTILKCVTSYLCSAQYLHISLWVKFKVLGRTFKVLHNLKPLLPLPLTSSPTILPGSPLAINKLNSLPNEFSPQALNTCCLLYLVCSTPEGSSEKTSSFKCFVEDVFSDHLYKFKYCSSASLYFYILVLHSTHYHLTYCLLLDIYWLVDPTER